jgi:hypothetical protein
MILANLENPDVQRLYVEAMIDPHDPRTFFPPIMSFRVALRGETPNGTFSRNKKLTSCSSMLSGIAVDDKCSIALAIVCQLYTKWESQATTKYTC